MNLGALIEVVLRHGGDITHFAGDALCAVWPQRGDQPLGTALHRAARAALHVAAPGADPADRQGCLVCAVSGVLFSQTHCAIERHRDAFALAMEGQHLVQQPGWEQDELAGL